MGYSGALCLLQKGKLPCPYLESNLYCPAITLTLSIATEGVSRKLCVPELIKICHFQRLHLWQKGTMQENYFKVVYSCFFYINVPVSFPRPNARYYIYIHTHTHTHTHTYIYIYIYTHTHIHTYILLVLYICLV